MDMNNDIATLPKKGLKTKPYSMDMEKRDLKKYDYTMYMDMEKKDLKKLTKGQLRRISCHDRNNSQASCEYSLTNFSLLPAPQRVLAAWFKSFN